MPFDYGRFRAAFIERKRQQRAEAEAEARAARRESMLRPTEFAVEIRLRAAEGPLDLSETERRVLHFDRLYLSRTPFARSDAPDADRIRFVAYNAHVRQADVLPMLDAIEQVFLRAAILEIEIVTTLPTRCQRERRSAFARKIHPGRRLKTRG